MRFAAATRRSSAWSSPSSNALGTLTTPHDEALESGAPQAGASDCSGERTHGKFKPSMHSMHSKATRLNDGTSPTVAFTEHRAKLLGSSPRGDGFSAAGPRCAGREPHQQHPLITRAALQVTRCPPLCLAAAPFSPQRWRTASWHLSVDIHRAHTRPPASTQTPPRMMA